MGKNGNAHMAEIEPAVDTVNEKRVTMNFLSVNRAAGRSHLTVAQPFSSKRSSSCKSFNGKIRYSRCSFIFDKFYLLQKNKVTYKQSEGQRLGII
jgi:hypothetical protein